MESCVRWGDPRELYHPARQFGEGDPGRADRGAGRQHRGRGPVPAGPLPLRGVEVLEEHPVLHGGGHRLPQGEYPVRPGDPEHPGRPGPGDRAAARDPAERRGGPGHVVGGPGVQGPGAGILR